MEEELANKLRREARQEPRKVKVGSDALASAPALHSAAASPSQIPIQNSSQWAEFSLLQNSRAISSF